MIKTISLIHKNDLNIEVSNQNHIVDLLFGIKNKNLNTKDEDLNADALFVLHSFDDFDKWNNLLVNRKEKSVFVCPTQIKSNEIMKEVFNHKAIAKIIVSSEYYQKYFTKTLGFSTAFIKFIPVPVQDYRPNQNSKMLTGKRVVVTPASVRTQKDFKSLVLAMAQLSHKFANFHYIMLLSKHPAISEDEYLTITQELIDLISDNFKPEAISFITRQKLQYIDYLGLADIILLPYDYSNRMYLSSLFDGIVAHKPIVIPENNQTKDLIKRDIGALLYQHDNVQSIVDTCGLLLENKDIKNILIKQNSLISANYLYANILPQYMNLFRRLKEA